jgi:hypothetical protein
VKSATLLFSITLLLFTSGQTYVSAQKENLDISLNLETQYKDVNGSTSNQTVQFNGTVNITKIPGIPVVVRFDSRSINKEWPMEVTPTELYFIDNTPQQFIISIIIPGGWYNDYANAGVAANATYMRIPRTGTNNYTLFDLAVGYPPYNLIRNQTNTTNQTQPNATLPLVTHQITDTTMMEGLKTIFMNPVSVSTISIVIVVVVLMSYIFARKRKARLKRDRENSQAS